jgi:hypothetical protein
MSALPQKHQPAQVHPADLVDVAAQLDARPRETLDWHSAGYRLNELLSHPFTPGVALAARDHPSCDAYSL